MSTPKPAILFVAMQTGAEANGGIASLAEIMRSLDGFRPILLTNADGPAVADWRGAGIEVHVVPEGASAGLKRAPIAAASAYLRYYRAVRRILASSEARIVHANDPLAYQLAWAGARSIPGTNLVFSIRDTLDPNRSPPRRRFRWIFGTADHTFFLSHDMEARWRRTVPPGPKSASATYSVVDFDRFFPKPLFQGEPKVVLISGVVSPKKGQLRFLQLVAPALANKGIECWLSGDFRPDASPYAKACAVAAADAEEHVKFLGYRRDMPELIARAHVVCITSQYEGLMRTMIEAMASGRPVISTDVSSAREMLERDGCAAGAVVPLAFDASMADVIIRLCNDPLENGRLGGHGARIARQLFNRQSVLAAYERTYERLSARTRR